MKNKIISTIVLFFIGSLTLVLNAQTVSYTYDSSGNITSRKIIQMTRSLSSEADPINQSEILNDREVNIKIYPNPTKGLIVIDILDSDDNENMNFYLYDTSGMLIFKEKCSDNKFTIDITNNPDGIYILKMDRNGESSTWRIIKK